MKTDSFLEVLACNMCYQTLLGKDPCWNQHFSLGCVQGTLFLSWQRRKDLLRGQRHELCQSCAIGFGMTSSGRNRDCVHLQYEEAKANMSAHETTPGQAASTAFFALSMTKNACSERRSRAAGTVLSSVNASLTTFVTISSTEGHVLS